MTPPGPRDPERGAMFRLILGAIVLVSLIFIPEIDRRANAEWAASQERLHARR